MVIKMNAVDVLGGVDELTDGTGGSVDAAPVTEFDPYRKSRTRGIYASERWRRLMHMVRSSTEAARSCASRRTRRR
jgi:hypothetical protein